MRAIISYDYSPTVETIDIKSLDFGKNFKGQHRVWTWRFSPDRLNVFDGNNTPLGGLINDLDQIPVIKKLTETIIKSRVSYRNIPRKQEKIKGFLP